MLILMYIYIHSDAIRMLLPVGSRERTCRLEKRYSPATLQRKRIKSRVLKLSQNHSLIRPGKNLCTCTSKPYEVNHAAKLNLISQPLYAAYIDLKESFNSVDRRALSKLF